MKIKTVILKEGKGIKCSSIKIEYPSGETVFKIKKGETLVSVSRRLQKTIDKLPLKNKYTVKI